MTAPRYQLLVLSDQRRGERINLESEELSIGRSGEVTIQFDNPSVSRNHAILRLHGDRLMIEDIGSSGGTKVNNSRIESNRAVQVENGDEVVFGSFHTQVLEIDEYDDQFDDGEATMFGDALDLPDDLDEVLALCEQNSKNGHNNSPTPEVAQEEAPRPQLALKKAAPAVESTPAAHAPPNSNPYKAITIVLSVLVLILVVVAAMAVFKWPVDLTAFLD
jgi:predicted component of type VI protein secretion system